MTQVHEMYFPGLEGIIAGETEVSTVEQSSLAYRGYSIQDLAEHASFEECAYLLLHGELPAADALAAFRGALDSRRELPGPVVEALRHIPRGTNLMDVLRTGVSMAGHFDETSTGDERAVLLEQATRVLAWVPSVIAARLRFIDGKDPLEPQPGLSHAAQVLYLAFGRTPTPLEEKIVNLTLILYAEHEFNASTFAARVCISTLSDLYSAVVAAIGTLKGPLHGGANEATARLVNRFRSADEATTWTREALAKKEKIVGFGHRVYKHGDHRAHILEPYVDQLAAERNESGRAAIYHAITQAVWDEKQLYPNVDYPCGLVYSLLGLPLDIYTPLFVASRVSGWCAHIIEQRMNNRLIRPLSRYVGPPLRPWVPVEQR